MQGSITPITSGEALICQNLHGLEGEGTYDATESGAENLTLSEVRNPGVREQPGSW